MNMGGNDKMENGTKSLDGQKKRYQLLATSLPIYPSKLQTFSMSLRYVRHMMHDQFQTNKNDRKKIIVTT